MAQKFVLIPEVMYKQHVGEQTPDIRSDILNTNLSSSKTVAALSAAARTPVHEEQDEGEETTPSTDNYATVRENIFNELLHLKSASKVKSRIILEEMINNNRIAINPNNKRIYLDEEDLGVQTSTFLLDLQRYNKKIPDNYIRIISALNLPSNVIVNKFAKAAAIPDEDKEEGREQEEEEEEEWLHTFGQ